MKPWKILGQLFYVRDILWSLLDYESTILLIDAKFACIPFFVLLANVPQKDCFRVKTKFSRFEELKAS